MTPEAKSLFSFIAAAAAILAAVASLNFAMDPLQLFHSSVFSPARYNGTNQRLQNAGLIQSQTFNAVLMGSSLAAGIQPSEVDRTLGVKSIKLVMNGSGAREQSFVLEAALKKKVDVVIWEIDHWIFRNDLTDLDSQSFFPANLYRKNVKGAFEYLLNISTTQESLGLLISEATTFQAVHSRLASGGYLKFVYDDLDSIGVPRNANHSAALGIKAYRRLSNPNINYGSANGYVYQSLLGNFEYDVIRVVEKHPAVRFLIYFPPYSILHYAAMRDFAPDALETFFSLSTDINRRLVVLPNVELFDFRDVDAVTHNLDNYWDTRHFLPAINARLLENMRDGWHRVSKEQPTAALDRLRLQVAAYQVPSP
jgi:hypothetical protein